MISYLDGVIITKKEKFILLNVNGVGYKVFLSRKTLAKLPEIGANLKVFCFLNVKENIMDLYGFLNYKELEFFETLDSIRGVGPKAALEISS
jgi:Holliday junction DNA helicase RuvA